MTRPHRRRCTKKFVQLLRGEPVAEGPENHARHHRVQNFDHHWRTVRHDVQDGVHEAPDVQHLADPRLGPKKKPSAK